MKSIHRFIVGVLCVFSAASFAQSKTTNVPKAAPAAAATAQTPTTPPSAPSLVKATFAGGCFWCMVHPFDAIDGVVSVKSGYTGGSKKDPTYQEVSAGYTGHTEAVQIVFDPKKVTYDRLLNVFWRNIDPTVKDQQFCDHGNQYRSGIFAEDAQQKAAAEASKAALAKSKPFKGNIETEIVAASTFYPAEEYHQDYYKKNPLRYAYYRNGCGRDARLKALWGDQAGGGTVNH